MDEIISTLGKGKSQDRVLNYKTLLKNNSDDERIVNAMVRQLIKEPNSNTFHLVAQLELGAHYFEMDDFELGETKLPWLSILHQRITKCRNSKSRNRAIYWLKAFHRRSKVDKLETLKLLKSVARTDEDKDVRFAALQAFMEFHRGTTNNAILEFLINRYDECQDSHEKRVVYSKIVYLGFTPEIKKFVEKELEIQPMREPSELAQRFNSHPEEHLYLMSRFFEIFKRYYSEDISLLDKNLDDIRIGLFNFLESLLDTVHKPNKIKLLKNDDFLLYLGKITDGNLKTTGDQISVVSSSKLFRKLSAFCRHFHDNIEVSRQVLEQLVKSVDDNSPLLPEVDRYFILNDFIKFNQKYGVSPESTLASLEPWWQKQSKELQDRVNQELLGVKVKKEDSIQPVKQKETEKDLKECLEIARDFLTFISPEESHRERDRVWMLWKTNIEATKIVSNYDLICTIFYSTIERDDVHLFSVIQDLRDYSILPDYFDSMRESLKLDFNQSIYTNDEEMSMSVDTQLSIYANYLRSNGFNLVCIDNGNDEYAIVAVAQKKLVAFSDFMAAKLNNIKFDLVLSDSKGL